LRFCFHFYSSSSESSSSESSDVDEESFVPLEIQDKLKSCLVKDLVPDVMNYLAEKIPKMHGIKTQHYPLETLVYPPFNLDPAFNKEEQYDLFKMVGILKFPKPRYFKSKARVSVGAAIRISKAIEKVEHADKLDEIVKECFTPEEFPDLTGDCYRYAHMNWHA
jgi:hypothetical protein